MSPTERGLMRIAQDIRDQLQLLKLGRRRAVQHLLAGALGAMRQLHSIYRKLGLCHANGWEGAAARIMGRIEPLVFHLCDCKTTIPSAIEASNMTVPSTRDTYQELLQAEAEFGEMEYRPESGEVVVVTDDVELEDVYLGPFEIRLRVPSLPNVDRDGVYTIVALDPSPAQSDSAVTHPHVRGEILCAGDAAVAIHAALANGRIFDFFCLVRSVLTHYNPSSPYVPLDAWHGVSCYECGHVTSEDTRNLCYRCEHDFCDECMSWCHRCEQPYCINCTETCRICESTTCMACMKTCAECQEELCQTCLEDDKCFCNEEDEENDHVPDPDPGQSAVVEDGLDRPAPAVVGPQAVCGC